MRRESRHFSNFGGNNHKYRPAPMVVAEYGNTSRVFKPSDFPVARAVEAGVATTRPVRIPAERQGVERARRYLAAIPPAVAGQHGDVHTFRVCCRLVRGFALDDAEALIVLSEWNRRCEPPWTELEMRAKLRSARRHGREPVGALLERS